VLAETELRHLAAIPYQLISPSGNSPIIGIFQDGMIGSYRFTRPNITFTPREAMNLLMMFPNVDVEALRSKGNKITNFDIISQILPPFTISYKTNLYDEDVDEYATSNNVLEIRNGKYIRGQIDKSCFGSTTKGIIHRIHNDFGSNKAVKFIDDMQNIITEYMKSSSFSVGISDLIANKTTQDKIIHVITRQKQEAQSLIDKVHLGIFENNTATTNIVEFENSVNNILNEACNEAGKIGRKSLSKSNRFVMIVNSGSKGSPLNISQMISCLGQTNVDGKRIPYGFDSRTLPHFSKFDDTPGARGFVENSYISGLTAPELFFHAMGGRIGLIDTAVKTSQTGYIQRRLIKGLEDLKVEYDMTVRNNKGKIIQFAYGDDGFDSTRVENQSIPLVGMSSEDIYMHYDMVGVNDQHTELLKVFTKATVTRIKRQKNETKDKCKNYIEKTLIARDNIVASVFLHKNDNMVKMPISFQNMINNVQGQLHLNANSTVDITPLECFQLVEEYFEKLNQIRYVKPNSLFEILYYFYLTPKDLLINKRFHRKGLVILLETIILRYKQAIVHPGEMVGIIAGQSLGEPTTQLTLNSVTYETEIVVRNQNNEIQKVQIGDFIENGIATSKKIEYMAEKDTTYAELVDYYEVPSANESGETVWRRIEAVTRHPVINEDGTNTMLKLTTEGCREVIVTKAKSLLKLVDGKIQEINGSDFKIGDYLPCSRKPLEYKQQSLLDLKTILPPTEYIYGSELEKAREVVHDYYWWSKYHGTKFTLPYSRSDTAYRVVKGYTNKNSKKQVVYKAGMVYTKANSICNYMIPEKIDLDYDFGYFVGAYASEGCMTAHQLSIANNDLNFFPPIQRICDKYNLTTKIYVHENKGQEGWTSTDLRIYSTVMCKIMEKLCGKLSHKKFVSDKIVFSNPECIRGFLDAYISGDGCVCKRLSSITVSSVSYKLLLDVQVMCKNMGIIGKITKLKKSESTNRGTKPENIQQPYIIRFSNQQMKTLANISNLSIKMKQDRVEEIRKKPVKFEHNKIGLKLPNCIDGEIVWENRNGRMMDLEFDKVVKIEEVPNTTNYAYDLTVEDTRNFDCYNAVCISDTFHSSGISSKTNVTRGVPRIEEILRLTKNPKNPSLTIHLNPMDETDKNKATQYSTMMEHTKLVDVIKSVQICFDPNDQNTTIEEDRLLMEQFYEFEKMVKDCLTTDDTAASSTNEVEQQQNSKSKWLIRMEIDAETLLEKNITMDDIHFAIKNVYPNETSCIYTDYNDNKLIFRIRFNKDNLKKGKHKGIPETLDQSDEIYMLRNFQDALLNNVVLRGISKIRNVSARKIQNSIIKEGGKYVRKDTWVLDTTGTNLMGVLALEYIDYKRTYSNDIKEIFDVLGIEAARQIIFNEFSEVMEFSGGIYINYHHLSILCDRMTSNRNMVSIFRSGILNDDIGPISKSTFEVHTEVLLNASRHAEFDHMRGVSANVMMGQTGYFGTGCFQLVMDMDMMQSVEDDEVNTVEKQDEIDKLFGGLEDSTDTCSKKNVTIKNNLVAITESNIGKIDDDYELGF
jgi:DNA-directed RNA polymerase beta' subunit